MANAPAYLPSLAAKWTVTEGPMKGASRLMQGPEFVMGRSPECDFVIVNDPRVSRRHAIVTNAGQIEISAVNDKNAVLVNGREISRHKLKDGDIVTIGSTELVFNFVQRSDAGRLSVVPNGAPIGAPGMTAAAQMARPAPARSGGGGPPVRLIIYGLIALVGYWLFFSDSPVKKKQAEIRTEQQIQADIEAANKLKEASEASQFRKVDMNITLRQAQENYVRGFRDFEKGQFERAMISFQACLALNPEHVLCNRYMRLTQRKFDELVQYSMVLGRKYRDQNQFKACRASFRNVMVMVKDAGNKTFQEAKANYEACDSLIEGRY